MPKRQCEDGTAVLQRPKRARVLARCCKSRMEAASAGHISCYKELGPYTSYTHIRPCLQHALLHGNEDFAAAFLCELPAQHSVTALQFARFCVQVDDAASLTWVLSKNPDLGLEGLSRVAICTQGGTNKCLHLLLERQAPWDPQYLNIPARENWLDKLEVILAYKKDWCPTVPGNAAMRGNVRLLRRIFEEGCPIWTSADDGEPHAGMDITFHLARRKRCR